MNSSDKDHISKKIAQILKAFGQDSSLSTLSIYTGMLAKHSRAAVEQAIDKALEDATGVFRPANIVQALGGAKLAEKAADQAKAVSKLLNYQDSPEFYDPITARIMSVYLPYGDWRNRPRDDREKFFFPMFTKKYREIANDSEEMKAVKAQAGKSLPQPKKKADPEVIRDNKAWFSMLQQHNSYRWGLYLEGDMCDVTLDSSTGVYPYPEAAPILFGNPSFRDWFEKASQDERFRLKDVTFNLTGPPRPYSDEETQEKWDGFMGLKGKDGRIPMEQALEIIGKGVNSSGMAIGVKYTTNDSQEDNG